MRDIMWTGSVGWACGLGHKAVVVFLGPINQSFKTTSNNQIVGREQVPEYLKTAFVLCEKLANSESPLAYLRRM